MWSLHGIGEWKFVQMISMAAMPIYGKNLKKFLLWNQKANDLESWYAASDTRVLPNLFKWWPWVALDLFYGKVKFDPLCFLYGEKGNTRTVRGSDYSPAIVLSEEKDISWTEN